MLLVITFSVVLYAYVLCEVIHWTIILLKGIFFFWLFPFFSPDFCGIICICGVCIVMYWTIY